MRILCPTDFSAASINGIEYAAHLAQRIDASLMLINVQLLALNQSVSLDVSERSDDMEDGKILELLEFTAREIEDGFKIKCDYNLVKSEESYEKVISSKTSEYKLTVIGSNGADDINQYYFGSHSFRMARHSYAPVMIVPEAANFSPIKNIVFASDFREGEELLLRQLKDFTSYFDAHIHILHISKEDTILSREVYNSFCRRIEDAFYFNIKMDFKRIIAENPTNGIESYMKKTNSDILTVFYQEHNFLYRIFHENLIKKITSYADFPVMIFHA